MAENKVQYGLKNVYYAPITEETADGVPTYGTPVKWPGAVSLSLEAEGDTNTFRADNTDYYVISANNGYTGELETARIPDSFRTDILGEIEDGGGMLVEDTDAAPVPFALMFQFEGDKRETRHVVYKCTAQRPTVESSTTDTEIEPQTETLEFTAQSVYSSALGTHIVKSKTTESTDSTVVSAWFTAVKLPTAASIATTSQT